MITVLLIDDEPAILDVTRLFLERTGAFSIETASSGAEALERLDSMNYDVIISDYEMPGMNGIELLKALKSRGVDVPFIIFTGKGREVVAVEALSYGATYYLQKGGEPRAQFAVLESMIEQAVQKKRAEYETRLSNLRLAEIVNFLPDPTFAINCEGIVIAWNTAIEGITGVKAADIISKGDCAYAVPFYGTPQPGLIDLLTATSAELNARNYTNVRHDGRALIAERAYVSLKGKPSVLWAKATPLCNVDGEVIGAIESLRDLTEQELQVDALQQRVQTLTRPIGDTSTLEFTDLFDIDEIQQIQDAFSDATGVASIITAPDGTPITRPSNFCRLCAEVIGGTPEGAATCMQSDAMAGGPDQQGPTLWPCRSGGLWDSGASIFVGNRRIANWLIGRVPIEGCDEDTMLDYADQVGVDRGVDARAPARVPQMPLAQFEKIAQALFLIAGQFSALALKNVQQSRMIAERMKAEEAIRMANKKLNLLSSVTRHDVQNQLTALRGFLNLAEEALDTRTRSQLMKKVMEATDSIHHQIDFTRDYQEIGLGSPQWQDLDTTIRRAASALDLQGVSLSIDVNGCSVYADPLLEKVFFNLLENAKRYATGMDRIRFSIEEQGEDRAVICTDNGPGIPLSEKERIFEAGYGKNTGYGLFLTSEILSITGLEIIESGIPEAGARFEIKVPADRFRCT